MKKRIWMSILGKNEAKAKTLVESLAKYGLEVMGHFWSNNLEKMEWSGPRKEIIDQKAALWLIVATPEELADETVRYGLSLLALTVQAKLGHGFPIVLLHEGQAPSADTLPTPLKDAEILPAGLPTLGAKLIAKTAAPPKKVLADYRIDVYGLPGLGEWFEVGPASGTWRGAMFGVFGGDINAHGVGPKEELPRGKMILNYPMEGLTLNQGDKQYTAWAVQNELDENASYFLRATGHPKSLLFGPFPGDDDEGEVFVISLK